MILFPNDSGWALSKTKADSPYYSIRISVSILLGLSDISVSSAWGGVNSSEKEFQGEIQFQRFP